MGFLDHLYDEVPEGCLVCMEANEDQGDYWFCPFFDVSECERANAADADWEMTR